MVASIMQGNVRQEQKPVPRFVDVNFCNMIELISVTFVFKKK
jgi:hypothetical protein